jgi:hypothetical protein
VPSTEISDGYDEILVFFIISSSLFCFSTRVCVGLLKHLLHISGVFALCSILYSRVHGVGCEEGGNHTEK